MNLHSLPLSMLSQGDKFELLASTDRRCYVLRSRSDYFIAQLQGEEAMRFEADYETVRQQFPDWAPDQTLAQLWDKGGYSWSAAQDVAD
ncbi:MAG TPA: hypothetical protein VMM15_09800 [Bradyrhizobium sp.]|nr:hypothetical protein [Bradyrhizobium sp.]